MAPYRGSKAAAQAADNDDNDQPDWDSSSRNLALFLLKLKKWLPRQHASVNTFIRFGFILNSRQKVVVFDSDHKARLQAGGLAAGTFENPCQITVASLATAPAAAAPAAAPATAPSGSFAGVAPAPSTTPSTATSTPGLTGASDDRFVIGPETLTSFDEEVMHTIFSCIPDEDTVDDLERDCDSSFRKLLKNLHDKASTISTTVATNIETRMAQHYNAGIQGATVADFNRFKSTYSNFNKSRTKPKPDSDLATDYVSAVNGLGEVIASRLDSKLDYRGAHGDLRKTVDAIREVLENFESTADTNTRLHGKSGQSLLGKDPRKNINKNNNEKPKVFDTSKPWKQSDGDCPLKARGSGCDGKHWKKDCPNPNGVSRKPPARSNNNAPAADNPLGNSKHAPSANHARPAR